jgi:signal peptidase II
MPRAQRAQIRITLIAAVAVFAVDQLAKLAAVHWLQDRPPVSIFGGAVHLELLRNPGGPTGILANHPEVVAFGTIGALLAMLTMVGRTRTAIAAVALGLVLGAGSGNLADRILRAPSPFHGGVVDWLRPGWGNGVMNFADVMINVGILLGIVAILRARPAPTPTPEPAPPA